MDKIRFGMIGLSPGNGHPYSWSAICNGYDPEAMETCPFPVIPRYLAKQTFPADCLREAEVTHIWTQNRALSEHIALASRIPNVVDRPEDLIGQVDAVLLARDDYELHEEMSWPFLAAGLPVFVDKPLAVDRETAARIWKLQTYEGQLFTGTSFRYAKEFSLTDEEREALGELVYVDACVMKSWDKYGIHIVEPVLNLIGDQGPIRDIRASAAGEATTVQAEWESGLLATFASLGSIPAPVAIRLFGTKGFKEMKLEDTYSAFKASLQAFVDVIRGRTAPIRYDEVIRIVELIECGTRPAAAGSNAAKAKEADAGMDKVKVSKVEVVEAVKSSVSAEAAVEAALARADRAGSGAADADDSRSTVTVRVEWDSRDTDTEDSRDKEEIAE